IKPRAIPVPNSRISTCGMTFFSSGCWRPQHIEVKASVMLGTSRPNLRPTAFEHDNKRGCVDIIGEQLQCMCRAEWTAAKDMPCHRHEQGHALVNLVIIASDQNVQRCVLREDYAPHHWGIEIPNPPLRQFVANRPSCAWIRCAHVDRYCSRL